MNNKGFTLIELLAVIVILSAISLIIVSSVTTSLEKRDATECKEQIEIAKNAAKIYFTVNPTASSVTIKKLSGKENTADTNYFPSANKVNKLNDNDRIDSNLQYRAVNGAECSP